MATLTKELTSGRPLPLILNFTLPLLMGNLLQQTYSLVDAVIVGRFLGIDALASVGASTSVVFLILGFCNGCCGGFGIPVAQKFGARDYGEMRRYVFVSLRLAAVMSVAVAAVTSFWCGDILRIMQTPGNIFPGAYAYLLVTFLGIPCTFYYNLLACVIRALGDSRTPFWFLLFSTVLNIVLDLFCILVLGWGVAGAAIATVFSQGVSAALCYRYMMRRFEVLRGDASERRFSGKLARRLLSIGVPMGLQFSITAVGSIMLQSANNALGTACVAAFTAAVRIKMFFMCPFESLGIAMATYGGQNYGAGKPERVWQGVKASSLMMTIYWVFTFCVLMTCAPAGPAVRRWLRDRDSGGYGAVSARFRFVFPCAGTALHPALHHSGRRLHESGDAFGRVGDDRADSRQPLRRAGLRVYRRLLRRLDGLGLCRSVSHPGVRLRLSPPAQDEAAASRVGSHPALRSFPDRIPFPARVPGRGLPVAVRRRFRSVPGPPSVRWLHVAGRMQDAAGMRRCALVRVRPAGNTYARRRGAAEPLTGRVAP